MNLEFINPFSAKFLQLGKEAEEIQTETGENASGIGEDDIPIVGNYYYGGDEAFSSQTSMITFQEFFTNKLNRVSKYREMANYPEISLALDAVCDEAIAKNSNGDMVNIDIKNPQTLKKSDIKVINREFEYVMDYVFNFEKTGWDLFWKYLVDGELFLEIILNTDKTKVLGLKPLPAYQMTGIYVDGVIEKFTQQIDDKVIYFARNQIAYINFGKYGANKQDTRGYLDSSVKVFNQLVNLEDAVVIYRLVRAPERRVWNIEVGQAPAGKAEALVKNVMQRYKNTLNYNSETGMISSSQNFQALTEDFWFSQRDGAGSSVDTIQGGQQLGEMSDINYFLMKLYKSLKIPQTRWGGEIGESGTQYTNTMDIEREELNFTKFVERAQIRFVDVISQVFLIQMQLTSNDPALTNEHRYHFSMEMNNHFRQYRDLEFMKEKLDMISSYDDITLSSDNPGGTISQEFLLKYIVKLPNKLAVLNTEMLDAERLKIEESGGFEE